MLCFFFCFFLDFVCEGNKNLPNTSSDPITIALEFANRITENSVTCRGNTGSASESMEEDLISESDSGTIKEPNFGRAEGNAEESDFWRAEGNVEEPNFGRAEGNAEESDFWRAEGNVEEPNFGRAEGNEEESNFGRAEGNVEEPNFGRAEGNVEEPNFARAEGNVTENEDSGTEDDMLCTPEGIPRTPEPELDTFSALEEAIEDFDYDVEIFDWENFQADLDSVENMDFLPVLA